MCKQDEYNGWRNKETWLVNLWMTNDEGSQELLEETANMDGRHSERADALEELVEEFAPELPNGLFSDLLKSALGRVDWGEIIEMHAKY